MKITDLFEGGWDTTITQNTVLKPAIVKVALNIVDQFVADFNKFNQEQGIPPIQRGRPTGSSAYHEQDSIDNPDNVYGDIDLQMIAPINKGTSNAQFTTYWNDLTDNFAKSGNVQYVDTTESKPGHPIFALGNDQFVQIDFMWHPGELAAWGAARVTPERGQKGLLTGNMFSVLGELLDMSIQHAGVQLKVIDGQQVPFSKQKGTQVVTVSIDPKTFIYDIFKYMHQQLLGAEVSPETKVDPTLLQNSGTNIDDVKIARLVNGVKGLANSFEMNGMYGKGNLANFKNAQDFLSKFIARYDEKAQIDIAGKKRDKAQTPDAIARANADREKIQKGLDMVKGLF